MFYFKLSVFRYRYLVKYRIIKNPFLNCDLHDPVYKFYNVRYDYCQLNYITISINLN